MFVEHTEYPMTDQFVHKVQPFKHQSKVFVQSREKQTFALFMEQGTGKTKVALDTVSWLYLKNKVDALLILAPNGVHKNWIVEEIPKHLPDYIPRDMLLWQSVKAGQRQFKNQWKVIIQSKGLAILAMNYNAAITKAGKKALQGFLNTRKVFFVLDESTAIKNPRAKRTISILALGHRATYRRILTGTPAAEGPLGLYTQFGFLDSEIFGNSSYFSFKREYAVWQQRTITQNGKSHRFDELVEYQNLDRLQKKIGPHSYRVTKEQCLDLPPKIYLPPRYITLATEQRRVYDTLKEELWVELDSGKIIEAPLAITMLMRLQQITCGYEIPPPYPRLNALLDVMEETSGKVIVWARFRWDIDMIVETLNKKGYTTARYDGKQKQLEDFTKGDARVFVSNPHAGGYGITLNMANTVIYYSNDFSLETRLQSEDRAHRIGQHSPVTYIDFVAEDTVDEKIVQALRDKKDISKLVMGEGLQSWLR